MLIARDLDGIPRHPGSVVTVGTFDGIHRGHQVILSEIVRRARARSGRSVLITFFPHPQEVLRGTGPVQLLTPADERAALLDHIGLDLLVVVPFTRDFSMLSSTEFVEDVIVRRVGLAEVVLGYDHAFGHNREGSVETFRRLAPTHGFAVDQIEAVELDTAVISSSRIRALLRDEGDVRRAADLLGRPYRIAGEVVQGDQRGRIIGYPTANLAPTDPVRKLLPRRGVYAVRATLPDGTTRGGMMNLGTRPTVRPDQPESIEAHLFDYSGDLYGQPLALDLVARLRDEQKFASLAALTAQLARDESAARAVLA